MPVLITTQGLARPAMRPADVRARAERMLRAMRLEDRELSILLCDDATIHALNRTFRRKNKPTDVLAFAMQEGEPGAPGAAFVLGDVAISLDTAGRQAREQARSLEDEVTMLLAHGLLHLLGLDHRDRTEERRMTARTDLLRASARPRRSRGADRAGSPRKGANSGSMARIR
jgi:probable rRNA maturation factor